MAEKIVPLETLVQEAKALFQKEFGCVPQIIVSGPGRVNLIGEHVDYCEGLVLPTALPLVTLICGKRIQGEQSEIVTAAVGVDEPRRVILDMPAKEAPIRAFIERTPKWANYVKGVIVNYKGDLPSFQAVIVSTVPVGGGLSSSAALEVATYTFLDALNGVSSSVDPTEKALACQKAEHEYAEMPCGIMDQFISVMGKKDHALLIDCRSLTAELIPFSDPDVTIVITNSNVKHELTGSEYPQRRAACQEAALILKKISLRDATQKDIDYLISLETNDCIVKRARHVVGEIERVKQAAEALKSKDFKKFGQLMVESHNSLKNDFEVSCPEVDSLVELALQVDGVLGSRMTGGGFGGCTITLVRKANVDELISKMKCGYSGKATFYVCQPSDGAKVINCC